jgi:3-hydroxyisobutyrate dehydrogenase-like beta-hydroxyacid dehydrogenase
MNIGFLGLGTMGKAMAANLVKAGDRVRVWNRSMDPVSALVALGAIAATSPREAPRTRSSSRAALSTP